MVDKLKKAAWFKGRKGPVVLVIMDGVGFGKYADGDAVATAYKPNLDWMFKNCPNTKLKAHGLAVGLPSDADMGNSEVGHNAIGSGRVFAQGAKLVSNNIETGKMFEGKAWKEIAGNVIEKNSTLHFIGLFSDGNVHSHIDHLKAMMVEAAKEGVKKIRVHILLDGRDVGETSALTYVDPFEDFMKGLQGCGAIDQDLGAFVIAENGKPVGTIEDGDSVVYFNFRGDRALEITAAFEGGAEFDKFDRKRVPNVVYAGMMEYDGDLHVPKRFLTSPPSIDRVQGEYLCAMGVRTLAVSETQKYGHVTYFYNGNRSGKIDEKLEDYIEVPSDVVPFEQRPWMKGAEITDVILKGIESGKYDFIRCNFPNGDMVGHTGVYQAAQIGVECVDLCIGRIKKAVDAVGGVMVITADHGNADDMYEHKKDGSVSMENGVPKVKTAHSLNPVPCIVYDPAGQGEYQTTLREGLGISSIAATVMNLLGYEAPEDYDPSVLIAK